MSWSLQIRPSGASLAWLESLVLGNVRDTIYALLKSTVNKGTVGTHLFRRERGKVNGMEDGTYLCWWRQAEIKFALVPWREGKLVTERSPRQEKVA